MHATQAAPAHGPPVAGIPCQACGQAPRAFHSLCLSCVALTTHHHARLVRAVALAPLPRMPAPRKRFAIKLNGRSVGDTCHDLDRLWGAS